MKYVIRRYNERGVLETLCHLEEKRWGWRLGRLRPKRDDAVAFTQPGMANAWIFAEPHDSAGAFVVPIRTKKVAPKNKWIVVSTTGKFFSHIDTLRPRSEPQFMTRSQAAMIILQWPALQAFRSVDLSTENKMEGNNERNGYEGKA